MDSSIEQLLYLIAEVSIATVALSGITMFLAVSNMRLDIIRSSLINTQLRMAFAVTIFSIIPLFAFQLLDFSAEETWRVVSALYLFGILYLWVQAGIFSRKAETKLKPAKLAVFAALTAIVLLTANIWLAAPWPYMLQLLIAWSCSMVLYLGFIQSALDEKVEKDGGT